MPGRVLRLPARIALCLFESTIAMSLQDSLGMWLAVGLSTVLWMGRLRTHALRQRHRLVLKMVLGMVVMQYTQGYLAQVHPSWWWHPFAHLWGWRAVECAELEPALHGLCAEEGGAMCLSDDAWDLLSGGALSSKQSDDVHGVEQGVQLAASSTLVVAALARDIISSVGFFRMNVEALAPFWKSTAVVIFENDSLDGTREALAAWAATAVGHTVRVVECEESPGCRLKHGTWYHSKLKQNQLASYRNRLLEDVLRHTTDPRAHLLVMDVDLGVSISPLGVLHTLGVRPLAAVAASGRSPKPTSVGSLVMPYDISAFRPDPALFPPRLIELHEAFCRFVGGSAGFDRATCDFASPVHGAGLRAIDQYYRKAPYGVASAFNGATIYPLEQLRLTGVRYDTSETSKGLCEHVTFHSQLRASTTVESGFSAQMYVNPKWAFLVSPNRPPCPTGIKFIKYVRDQGGAGSLPVVVIAVVGALCEILLGTLVLHCLFWVLGVKLGGANSKTLPATFWKASKTGKASKRGKAL
jgi:hypothetical protein